MIIPKDILNSVIFLCYRDRNENLRFAGTAFFIGAKDQSGVSFVTLVTANHVIAGIQNDSVDGQVLLRLNQNDGGVAYIERHVSEWKTHPDTSEFIDVALIEWGVDPTPYNVAFTNESIAVTEEMFDRDIIGIGNEVCIVGLFTMQQGENRNTPIIRSGNIAMLPDEKIKTKQGNMKGYLIESRSIGGLSGSPVFVYNVEPFVSRDNSESSFWTGPRIHLLGLIHGHLDVKEPTKDDLVEDMMKRETINMGIAIVTPVSKILETINQLDLLSMREKRRQEKD